MSLKLGGSSIKFGVGASKSSTVCIALVIHVNPLSNGIFSANSICLRNLKGSEKLPKLMLIRNRMPKLGSAMVVFRHMAIVKKWWALLVKLAIGNRRSSGKSIRKKPKR